MAYPDSLTKIIQTLSNHELLLHQKSNFVCIKLVSIIFFVIQKKTPKLYDCLAQLVEHWIPNPKAIGSNPVTVTVTVLLRIQVLFCSTRMT